MSNPNSYPEKTFVPYEYTGDSAEEIVTHEMGTTFPLDREGVQGIAAEERLTIEDEMPEEFWPV